MMNRKNEWLAVLFVAVFFIVGCGNHSGLKGKIIDEDGQPVEGLTIVAKQVQPIEGYERLEAVTDKNGEFHFKKLYPSSKYVLEPLITDWKSPFMVVEIEEMQLKALLGKKGWLHDNKLIIQSGPEGETMLLASSIILKLPHSISLGMDFVYIEPGTFMMGSPEDEPGRRDDETQHEVTLTQGYYMQTTPVTQGQWEAVMGSNPSIFSNCGYDCPVESVSWIMVQDFITELNQQEGTTRYALPTEAQWEYAARAGSTTAFANGQITETGSGYDPVLDSMGWYIYNSEVTYAGCIDVSAGEGSSCAGAQKAPNAWGLYDMHGNVWEWVADWYGTYPTSAVTDPTGPPTGATRVMRGGRWGSYARYCRSATRGSYYPGRRFNGLGFRLVLLPGH